ncbi:hypothetical protein QHG17_004660 [Escherichia coli]|nr:hypothetical protein [Escherichia coli]HEI0739209.1 hypothetical protein [Escherichia coli]HEI1056831.1 hypothetical protein [Escherichia coli]HEI1140112.1 hypothetical protein [Escherichia coli]HEI1157565.1 hypothetical protein [Escherichia coli]
MSAFRGCSCMLSAVKDSLPAVSDMLTSVFYMLSAAIKSKFDIDGDSKNAVNWHCRLL